MKVLEKMCLKIILKVTKDQSFTLLLEDTFSKNHRSGQIDPPPPLPPSRFRVKVLYGIVPQNS